ncbi:MAG: hypothetical protein A2928_02130 [Candidatus Taylorbacteria bacterium RIFCSPLOWO2_01_FULL_45_15b]|uniref:SHSP domain-containing protein n=1 Tax=Candidatus Taylorbacteria bacterium RIFCSPLOWO2_01_FULL_45_15b TaxID=1802319 RepID=A0A1G2N701_9BACT|nr:MAG: hypothetical protein A2928_02130 [Candidatus Taylorbacteria bacterium RIFCSPLOWO2_01_FULL_45_15b]
MAKHKRSFFERLTGAVRVDDDLELDEDEMRSAAQTKKDEAWAEETPTEGQLTVDVFQTTDDIIIKAMVAGVKPEDLDISITRDMVTIKGKREESKEATEDNFFYRELYWGAFSRSILLPQEIEVEEADAQEKYGLLTIRLPKIDKEKQTKLRVKSGI